MDTVQIEQQKQELRRVVRRRAIAEAPAMHAAGDEICRRALELPEYAAANLVMAFVSTASEPDTAVFLRETLRRGKRLALPFLTGPGEMEARIIDDLSALQKGPFGILQPPADAVAVPAEDIDFALVPCMATGLHGERLGHGGGYYDRFLPALGKRWVVACPDALVLARIPCLPHDLPAPVIVTERRVLRF